MRKLASCAFLICALLSSNCIYSQVGINNQDPNAALHVTGTGNTASDNTLRVENSDNTVAMKITGDGKVGIGMDPVATDASTLQINGPLTVKNAGYIESGTGYVLSNSDGTGQANWVKNVTLTPTVIGVLGSKKGGLNGYSGSINSTGAWIGISIPLPPGTWIIQSNVLLYIQAWLDKEESIWQRLVWSDSKNTQTASSDILAGRYVSGIISPYGQFGIAVGTTLLTNSSPATKTYYLNIGYPTNYGLDSSRLSWNMIGSGEWSENSIVAYPVVQPD